VCPTRTTCAGTHGQIPSPPTVSITIGCTPDVLVDRNRFFGVYKRLNFSILGLLRTARHTHPVHMGDRTLRNRNSLRCRTLPMSSDLNLFLTLTGFVSSVCVQNVSSSFLSGKRKMGLGLARDPEVSTSCTSSVPSSLCSSSRDPCYHPSSSVSESVMVTLGIFTKGLGYMLCMRICVITYYGKVVGEPGVHLCTRM
jgi:hypothetical protein